MAEPQFAAHSDDDLPRTLRRERDARQQRAQAQMPPTGQAANYGGHSQTSQHDLAPGQGPAVTVTSLDIPFFRLMAFFIKAVFASIPALILLGLVLYAMGQVAKLFFPWLVKFQILVTYS
jgi:hypothetical protein